MLCGTTLTWYSRDTQNSKISGFWPNTGDFSLAFAPKWQKINLLAPLALAKPYNSFGGRCVRKLRIPEHVRLTPSLFFTLSWTIAPVRCKNYKLRLYVQRIDSVKCFHFRWFYREMSKPHRFIATGRLSSPIRTFVLVQVWLPELFCTCTPSRAMNFWYVTDFACEVFVRSEHRSNKY